jgi:hypothetical protein
MTPGAAVVTMKRMSAAEWGDVASSPAAFTEFTLTLTLLRGDPDEASELMRTTIRVSAVG